VADERAAVSLAVDKIRILNHKNMIRLFLPVRPVLDGHKDVSVHKWPFSAISASIGGIACAAYMITPPANAADFLEFAENCTFLDRKLISAFNKTVVEYKVIQNYRERGLTAYGDSRCARHRGLDLRL
jgi:hypothetical protein